MTEKQAIPITPASAAGDPGQRPGDPEAFGRRRALLFEQYQAACAAIAMLSLYELATLVRAAFPAADVLILGDAEGGHLRFEHAQNDTGQIVASAEQVQAAGIDAVTIASHIGSEDIGRDTWIRYALYQRWQNVYRCPVQPVLDLPARLLTTPFIQLHARLGELEEFAAQIAALTKEGELPGRPDDAGQYDPDHEDDEGEERKEWENDDAFDTLHELITRARQLHPTAALSSSQQSPQPSPQQAAACGQDVPPA